MTGGAAATATVVVPCYNEADRLDGEAMLGLVRDEPLLSLLLVDDGSTDRTLERLRELAAAEPARVQVLPLPANVGKAEAVRAGLRQALDSGSDLVAYLDADLATPPTEVRRLLAQLRNHDAEVVIGARVSLLGRMIERSTIRHYLGRLFASAASLTLRLRVYDTQCGAKFFRASPSLQSALHDPFVSRWTFDVELLGRLLIGGPGVEPLPPNAIIEEPLREWRDVPGSKLRTAAVLGAGLDLWRVARDLRRRSHSH